MEKEDNQENSEQLDVNNLSNESEQKATSNDNTKDTANSSVDKNNEVDNITPTQKLFAIAAHCSFLLGGIGFLLVPLIIFLINKGKDEFVEYHAKQAFAVQLAMFILSICTGVLCCVLVGFVLMPVLFILALIWTVCAILASWKAANGELYDYPCISWLINRL